MVTSSIASSSFPSIAELRKYGFVPGNYERILVTWGATAAEALAAKRKVQLWDFRTLPLEISNASTKRRTYFTDDTARTIELFAMARAGRSPI